MARESTSYTLVGFAAEMDWRPLHFVRPIPRNWICSACGKVRKMNARLPCMHVLCDACYGQCGAKGLRICPLDAKECLEQDAKWMECPVEEVLKREVRCWNKEHGCGAVTAASDISQHFQRDCGHHLACCPKCSASVLCGDVCAHLRTACAALESTFRFDCDREPRNPEYAAFPASFGEVLKDVEQEAGEMRLRLEEMFGNVGPHGDTLTEISYGINSCIEQLAQATREIQDIPRLGVRDGHEQIKERLMTQNDAVYHFSTRLDTLEKTFTDELLNAIRQSSANCSRIVAIINNYNANSQKALKCTGAVLQQDGRAAYTVFYVKGVKSLQDKALRQGYAVYESEEVYLRGNRMAPGITLEKVGDSVRVNAGLRLRKDDMDGVVPSTFEHKIILSMKHPAGKAELHFEVDACRDFRWHRMLTESNPTLLGFSALSVFLGDLIRDGYVFDDQLCVKWEVLP